MRYYVLSTLCVLFFSSVVAQSDDKTFNEAEGLFAAGKYEEAAELYSDVIQADSDNLNAFLRRGFCNSVQKNYDKAIMDFTSVIDVYSEHPFAYISRGSAYNKLEKYELAMADFNKALSIDPKNQEAYNNRGWAKNGLELYKEACADWKTSKKLGNEEAKIILKNNHCK